MKLCDLIHNIEIQGPVTISVWHDDAEIILFETDDFEAHKHEIHDDVRDMETKFLFPFAAYTGSGAALKIELEPKEED